MDLIKPPARKGDKNRVSLSCRVEPETLEAVWQIAKEHNLSQGEVIDLWAKFQPKPVGRPKETR